MITVEDIAKVCHAANAAYCRAIGDCSQKLWLEAEEWQRDSAIKGVQFALANPNAPASSQHEAWLKDKLDQGWKVGPVKDAGKKEHPCCVPYSELPDEQKAKDSLFLGVVNSLKCCL